MNVTYTVNNLYKNGDLDERKDKFNIILSKIICILESIEIDSDIYDN